jgi:hypothetical protein
MNCDVIGHSNRTCDVIRHFNRTCEVIGHLNRTCDVIRHLIKLEQDLTFFLYRICYVIMRL